jgi:chromosome segregation ATPase|tara:strand:- start:55 stop:291 length:237 start_codon:yes stop_codon:yes gene_type:complete
MAEINVEQDLNAVNEQTAKLVEELNKLNSARDTCIQQIQNLQGIAMYLRGKAPVEETPVNEVPDIDFSAEPDEATQED